MPLESNSNDSLVALLLVATLLVLARPLYRGATLALATLAKFSPALLAPMLLTYDAPSLRRPSPASWGEMRGARGRTPRPQARPHLGSQRPPSSSSASWPSRSS